MSSIEKAIERLIAKKKPGSVEDEDFGSVEDIDQQHSAQPDQSKLKRQVKNTAEKAQVPDVSLHQAASSIEDKANPVVQKAESKAALSGEKRICHLDFVKLDEAGFLTPESSRRKLSEEYRMIKRPVLMNAFGHGAADVENGNLVVVTSATAGEGKTYTSLNLAISIALELDTTILLVDCDIIKTSLTKQLGLQNEPGFIDILKDKNKDLSEVMLATDLPNLKVIPAGKMPKNPTELLASSRMRQLVQELSGRYPNRIILFDAPPLLETTEASVIVDLMGQVLVVVEAAGVRTDNVKSAVKQINPDKVIGMILNKNRYASSGGYYGGYYGVEEENTVKEDQGFE